jgi:hypothetical protein
MSFSGTDSSASISSSSLRVQPFVCEYNYIHRYVSKNDCKMLKLIFWFVFNTLLIYICCTWLIEIFLQILYQRVSTCANLTFAFLCKHSCTSRDAHYMKVKHRSNTLTNFHYLYWTFLLSNVHICIINKY